MVPAPSMLGPVKIFRVLQQPRECKPRYLVSNANGEVRNESSRYVFAPTVLLISTSVS